jgi:formiminoglutamase
MIAFRKSFVETPETPADDPRLGHLIGKALEEDQIPRVVLIGFPSDEGVRLIGGREGAAHAPDAIRQALFRLTPDPEQFESFGDLIRATLDLGNLELTGNVEEDQERLGGVVSDYLQLGTIPVILGGGHETAFGHFLGYARSLQKISILNWDAHADVRPLRDGKAHSGSPFRQALEHASGACAGYAVAGLLPHAVSREHLSFILQRNGSFYFGDALGQPEVDEIYRMQTGPFMASFDLDAVDQSFAPAVSAPAANGLSRQVWLYAAYRAGQHRLLRSFDLVELNPLLDPDHRTARLAGLTVWYFLKGLAERAQEEDFSSARQ